MEGKVYLDAIGRIIPDNAVEQFWKIFPIYLQIFLSAEDGQFEPTDKEDELIFVPDGYYVIPDFMHVAERFKDKTTNFVDFSVSALMFT